MFDGLFVTEHYDEDYQKLFFSVKKKFEDIDALTEPSYDQLCSICIEKIELVDCKIRTNGDVFLDTFFFRVKGVYLPTLEPTPFITNYSFSTRDGKDFLDNLISPSGLIKYKSGEEFVKDLTIHCLDEQVMEAYEAKMFRETGEVPASESSY